MNKPESILTDAEMHALISGNPFTLGLSIARLKDFIRQVEKAVVAKLAAEQEPIAWVHPYDPTRSITHHQKLGAIKDGGAIEKTMRVFSVPAYAHPSPSDLSDKTACVSENGKSDRQLARHQPCGCVVCYCENQERCLGCGAKYCGTHDVDEIPNPVYVDHIADASKMVGSDHIPDIGKMIPEGWQLVPKEPTDAMLSCIMGSVGFESFTSWRVSASGRYMDMLATAPKFGDKQ